GTHTTTTARLFHFPAGGQLIDSPGIREFGLGHVSVADVEAGFFEFQEHLGHCRFRNCSHEHEPGCALLAAVEAGKIAPQRLASFKHIVSGINSEHY
ncbi:MAG: GTPase RsgA, partial [Thiopseudomonas sp.]|nr:GTPase RsgA [Thiopseudomonas sp.]